MSKPEVTIIDIAKALGVSKTTVSSALHGGGRVSESTRKRVKAMAESMGYTSNRAAQQLRSGRHHAIGLQIPEDLLNFAFYMEFAFGAAEAAAENDVDLLLHAKRASRPGHNLAVDGLLVIDPTEETFPTDLAEQQQTPIVAVGAYSGPGANHVAAWIEVDHRSLVQEVLAELKRQGAETPGHVTLSGRPQPIWMSQVTEGYEEWCRAQRIEPRIMRASIEPSDMEITEVLEAAHGCDALVWTIQGAATHARAVAARRGDHAIQMATMASDPGASNLVGIDLRARQYGQSAARLLLGVLESKIEQGTRITHTARLVAPES